MSEFVINDQSDVKHSDLKSVLCGCLPRREAYGSLPFASVPTVKLIPWEEMPDRIADQERNKSSLFHIWQDSQIGALDQNPLLWCWGYSSVGGVLVEREQMGLPYVPLSPSSVAGPVVNFANHGYYIESALQQMITVGVAPIEYVPETTNDASQFKLGWREAASSYRVKDWVDVGTNAQMQLTMLLTMRALVAARNWWGHAMLDLQALDRNPKLPANNPLRYGRKFLNSWGRSWGDKGIGVLEGQRAIADAAYAIKQASFVG